jgi:hypothetical protein
MNEHKMWELYLVDYARMTEFGTKIKPMDFAEYRKLFKVNKGKVEKKEVVSAKALVEKASKTVNAARKGAKTNGI